MDSAFFLVSRHPNVYLDISGIPPETLLKYFPRLEEIAAKTLFGTDCPGPGVPDIKKNLETFRRHFFRKTLSSKFSAARRQKFGLCKLPPGSPDQK